MEHARARQPLSRTFIKRCGFWKRPHSTEPQAENALSWTVYILRCSDDTLYTGITKDIDRRIAQHERGLGAKYTRGRGPYRVLYTERHETKGHALKREAEIKALDKAAKLQLISASFTVYFP